MRNIIISIVIAITFFIGTTAVVNLQFWEIENINREKSVRYIIKKIDTIIREAYDATESIKKENIHVCDTRSQFILGRETASKPHLRTIIIEKNNKVWCSSLVGKRLMIKGKISPPEDELTLIELMVSDKDTDKISLLVFKNQMKNGNLFATISDTYLKEALGYVDRNINPVLIVNSSLFNQKGEIDSNVMLPTHYFSLQSQYYPYLIGYEPARFYNVSRLFKQGDIILVFIFILSLSIFLSLKYILDKSSSLTESLKRALKQGDIIPFYQPLIDNKTNTIYGLEVLARWKHKSLNYISPEVFINLAEESGFIIELTKSIFKQVSQDLKNREFDMYKIFHLSLNISSYHFTSKNFVNDCLSFKQSINRENIKVVLEFTEGKKFLFNEENKMKLEILRDNGFLFALDDFGSGYSGLSYLKDKWVDYLKIDKSFVSQISTEVGSVILLDCVISLAQQLEIEIIAEGVETNLQISYLSSKNISLLQGYYFSKPVSILEILIIIRNLCLESEN
ncbi:EAL domain-containing protein [Klebsiella aerogenes]